MNIETKIEHLRTSAMEQARAEGNAIVKAHSDALEKLFNEHKQEMLRQSELRIKSETTNARQQLNTAMSKAQINLRKEQSKCQAELKEQLFAEVRTLIQDYMKTADYDAYLLKHITKAAAFANGEDLTIFINPTDADKKSDLEEKSGMTLSISSEDFIGGIRAVIPGRNVLIDHSFKAAIDTEHDNFLFAGGGVNA